MEWCLETGKYYRIYNSITRADYILKCVNYQRVYIYRKLYDGFITRGWETDFMVFADDKITEIPEENLWLYEI